ncbi:hypothetical protein, partial [Streptomyces sp. NPDC004270]
DIRKPAPMRTGAVSVVVGVVAADDHVVEGFFGDGFCSVSDGILGGLADELVEGFHIAAGACVEIDQNPSTEHGSVHL